MGASIWKSTARRENRNMMGETKHRANEQMEQTRGLWWWINILTAGQEGSLRETAIVRYLPQNKQRLFPYTALNDWFSTRDGVFTARYGLDLYI